MYPLTLLPLVEALVPNHAAVKLAVALLGVVLFAFLWSTAKATDELDEGPPMLPLGHLETVWPFFRSRHDFLARGFQLAGSAFRFKLLRVRGSFPSSSLSADNRLIEYGGCGVGGTRPGGVLLFEGP